MSRTQKPYRFTTKSSPGGVSMPVGAYRVIVVEKVPRMRFIHTLGYVLREGTYGWTAQTKRLCAPFGGYRTRTEAADALYEDWRADNLDLATRLAETDS